MPRGTTYVDNAYNRSVGRVGAAMGSAPVSRSSGGGGGGGGGASSSSSSHSTYVDNSYNRSVGRVGAGGGGGASSSSSSHSTYVDNSYNRNLTQVPIENTAMPRGTTYVDNAYNRSVGRAGAAMGSAPVSRSSGGGGGGGGASSSSSSHSTYVDNSYNRSVGRVGAPMGSMPVSRSSGGASSVPSQGTYVDNAYNRSHGRVGAPMGSMPVSRSSGGASSVPSQGTYVDNAYNRSHGRVGAPKGSMPVSRSSGASSVGAALGSMSISEKGQGSTASSCTSEVTKLSVDNALNRKLDRVGKPRWSEPHHRQKPTGDRVFKDNAANRKLVRVGKKIPKRNSRGKEKSTGQPASKEKSTGLPADYMKYLLSVLLLDDEPDGYDFGPWVSDREKEYMTETVFNNITRQEEEAKWQESNQGKRAQTDVRVFKYDDQVIPFEEINLGKKIGQGGFGDVHFAKWDGSVVAVKKLRVQRVSQKRLRQFQDEVKVLCKLDHPHIVKFLGACIVTPNLAIVIEYMQKNLYDALHVEDVDYSDAEQYQIITGMSDGLDYLHQKEVAHCDIKSTNILLDIPEDGVVAKISDFGLSMMKNEAETSQSVAKVVQGVGTPKYSAPEVLAGDELDLVAMCKADVYSMAVVAWEVICHEEPFFGLIKHQLERRVMGVEGQVEWKIPSDINISGGLLSLLNECWNRNANKRPSAGDFKKRVGKCGGIK
ncbi:serine/threonine-protein kinase A-Raf-like isoform X2 [Asterias rubens]|uniref:serine/threonine-protein kinase A-Raf-like isoform X2 n=1 Tax=Asterias rubens TaxID=7604 RepID=UPI001455A49B|nr:serine/threonine-protein kinase A-Raf-like isoform X2 [Asterias rubens]